MLGGKLEVELITIAVESSDDGTVDLANNKTTNSDYDVFHSNEQFCSNLTPPLLTSIMEVNNGGVRFEQDSMSSPVAVDIASSSQEDSVRPVNHQFPSTLIGNRERCFNPKWYEKYELVEYSISADAYNRSSRVHQNASLMAQISKFPGGASPRHPS